MPENGTRPIDEDLIRRWQAVPGDRERSLFYLDNILPLVTGLLGAQVRHRVNTGDIDLYDELVVLTAFISFPTLVIANSIRPRHLTLLYTPDKEHLLSGEIARHLDPSIEVEYVTLDRINHQDNFEIMKETVKRSIRTHRNVLCDITGGKKIMATQLAIIATQFEVDYSYIDARDYTRSPIPVPGEEVLYIHRPSRNELSSIRYGLPAYAQLIMSYSEAHRSIGYNLIAGGDSFRFPPRRLDESLIGGIGGRMDSLYDRINERIGQCANCSTEREALARQVAGNLLPEELKDRLSALSGGEIRLLLDPELSGIPWEMVLANRFGFAAPIFRMVNKDFYRTRDDNVMTDGILLVIGSGEGIDNFEEASHRLIDSFAPFPGITTVRARDRGQLHVHLPERPYRAIVYFGHARFGETPASTGWVCENGDIFSCESLEILGDSPPAIMISNACESARGLPFRAHSFAYAALRAGCDTYIGTHWLLELERSALFLHAMMDGIVTKNLQPTESFRRAIAALRDAYGPDDISIFNYVYYGK